MARITPFGPAAVDERLMALPEADGLATHALGLADLGKVAAGIIAERGWVQGSLSAATGEVCLHGALQAAVRAGGHVADYSLVSVLYARRGSTMSWNDSAGRTREEVTTALERDPLTDRELAEAFGPQWIQVVGLTRELHTLVYNGPAGALQALDRAAPATSLDDILIMIANALNLRCGRVFPHTVPEWVDSRYRPLDPMNQVRMVLSAMATATNALSVMKLGAGAGVTVRAAQAGLVLRHLLVGPEARCLPALGQAIYDGLTMPWRTAVGRLHPDDPHARYSALDDLCGPPSVSDVLVALDRFDVLDTRSQREEWVRLGVPSADVPSWAAYTAGGLMQPMVKLIVTSVT